MKGPALRLHPLNLSARVRERFEHLFSAAGRGAALLVNASVAEAVLVDLDAEDGAGRLRAYREQYPGRPALLLARGTPNVMAGDQVLLKPVAIRALLVALLRLREVVDENTATARAEATGRGARTGTADHFAPGSGRQPTPAHPFEHDDTPTVVIPRRAAARNTTADGDPPADATMARRAAAAGSDEPETTVHDDEPATMVMPRRPVDTEITLAGDAIDDEDTVERTDPGTVEDGDDVSRWADLCGSREDVDADNEDAIAELLLTADGLLLPRLAAAARQALESQQVLELRAGELKLVLDGASDYAYADVDQASVQALCHGGPVAGAMSVQPAGKPKAVLLSRHGKPTAHWPTVESAVWQAALWTYRGLLPSGTSLVERVYLSRWPNFTRLVELPHALRICALWVEQPLSLAETASLLRLPQRYVFALYGATHALGLSGPARRGADLLFETPPAMLVPHRPLLGRLVQHMRAPAVDGATPRSRAAV